jgi:NTE family protein
MRMVESNPKTAFVLAGGGSFGAVQVGMLRTLVAAGIVPDLIVGSSVGAINGAYLAGAPTVEGVAKLQSIWQGLRRDDVFPITARGLLTFPLHRDYLVDPSGLRRLIAASLPYKLLEAAAIPIHIVATDLLGGGAVRLSSGPAVEAILASCAIPAAFPPVSVNKKLLIDGAIASNSPIRAAVELGAARVILLPTGFACATDKAPGSAIASALHAITLLVANQLVNELERLKDAAELVTVPPLCPLLVSPYDFSRAVDLIDRAAAQTQAWLDKGGLQRTRIPGALRTDGHDHEPAAKTSTG